MPLRNEKADLRLVYLPAVNHQHRLRIEAMTRSSGFFSEAEVDIALEVLDDYMDRGPASGYHFILAFHNEDPVGYACFGPIPCTVSSFDLYWIVVDNRLRGRGIGRLLLGASEERTVQLGGTRMYLDTSSRSQYDPTRAFYSAAGYEVAAEMADFYGPGDAKVVFVKRLSGLAVSD